MDRMNSALQSRSWLLEGTALAGRNVYSPRGKAGERLIETGVRESPVRLVDHELLSSLRCFSFTWSFSAEHP